MSEARGATARAWTLRGLAALAMTAVSCGALLALSLSPAEPSNLATPPRAEAYPVASTSYRDQRTVALQPVTGPATTLTVAGGGTVTELTCAVGQPLANGSVVMRLDNAPVVALAAVQPLFRDLSLGDEGDDVEALRGALAALGHSSGSEGRFDPELADAVQQFQTDHGLDPADGRFRVSTVLRVPGETTAPARCDLTIGQTVGPGAPFGSTAGTLQALQIVDPGTSAPMPGDRTVRVAGIDATISEGAVLDPEQLAKIAASPGFSLTSQAGQASGLTGLTSLLEPVDVVAVPPGALFDVQDAAACVQSGAEVYRVRLVGSAPGSSLITFEDDAIPGDVLLATAITAERCDG